MIVNLGKFQVMTIDGHKKIDTLEIKINDVEIKSESSVTLLGVEIDKKINFNNHLSTALISIIFAHD